MRKGSGPAILISKTRSRTRRSTAQELFLRKPMADVRLRFAAIWGQPLHSGPAQGTCDSMAGVGFPVYVHSTI